MSIYRSDNEMTWLEITFFISLIGMIIWVKFLILENQQIKAELKGAYGSIELIQKAARTCPEIAKVSDSQCMGWLFDSDLAKTKARICGQK